MKCKVYFAKVPFLRIIFVNKNTLMSLKIEL